MDTIIIGEDRYLVKLDLEKNTKTKSGIILETSEDSKSYKTGVIIANGPGRITETGAVIPQAYNIGDHIMYEPRNEIKINLNGEDYMVVRQPNIICSYTIK